MNKKMLRLYFTTLGLLAGFAAWCQEGDPKKPEMAEAMRSNGKIYVVVAVLVTILTGLVLYVVKVDRKLSKLEKGA